MDLQYGDTRDQRRSLHLDTGIKILRDDTIDQLIDADLFASQVAAMDLVVTISNATAHFAGALAIPTLLMVDSFPLWYWMKNSENTPWYPSLTILRQTHRGNWGPVIEEVARRLEAVSTSCEE